MVTGYQLPGHPGQTVAWASYPKTLQPLNLMCLTSNIPHSHRTCGGVWWWWVGEVAARNQSCARHSSGPSGSAVNLSGSSWMGGGGCPWKGPRSGPGHPAVPSSHTCIPGHTLQHLTRSHFAAGVTRTHAGALALHRHIAMCCVPRAILQSGEQAGNCWLKQRIPKVEGPFTADPEEPCAPPGTPCPCLPHPRHQEILVWPCSSPLCLSVPQDTPG